MKQLLSLIQKRFLKTSISTLSPDSSPLPPTTTITNPSSSLSFTVQFLVNSCGLPLESAISASRKLHLDENNIQRTQSVLLFLKSHHFDDTQIANLIKRRPISLRCKVEGNLKPKFEFFIANGFAGDFLPQLILSNPSILGRSLASNIKSSLEFLKSYLDDNDKIVLALKRSSWFLTLNLKAVMQPNIDLLMKEGVPLDRVAKLIVFQPRTLSRDHKRVAHVVTTVKNLGLEPKSPMFIHAFATRMQMSDSTWKKKTEVMKSFGWSEEEILGTFKRYPQILHYSEKKITSAMDFFLNTVELSREILLAYPYLLCFSVDKRIRPRYNVVNLLKSKNFIKVEKRVPTFLIITEKKFVKNYVVKYADDVPGLLDLYKGTATPKNKEDS